MTLKIRDLFDAQRDIGRAIEKVISYQAAQEQRLEAEISEYIVTKSIEQQLEQLLERMHAAMELGAGHEIGVWVSGFYGSGKSSFTKYLGLAFDDQVKVGGTPFLKRLQDRLSKPTTKALLANVAKRFPAAVVMLDLAGSQLAGASLTAVSMVLYHEVLRYAGYSRNLKIAALERKARKDGRYAELEHAFRDETGGLEWSDYQNDELVMGSAAPRVAHKLYPELFRTEQSFTTASSDTVYQMDDLVQEMLDIVREKSGKEHIIFVIDEIGQYVGSQQSKILDLQGLAENLKNRGSGKVWIMGTAQQTLTEDDVSAALNSPELYKLKDRFPISVDLVADDIKEICVLRLLSKSKTGADRLGKLFDSHGQSLRQSTRLSDAKPYDSDFKKEQFTRLYPFLPAHFDILIHLLGVLAKSTGGLGLRSAIKVIQDILVESSGADLPAADREVGWLATTVTLYDALEKDIRRANQSLHQAVEKIVSTRYRDHPNCKAVAKTVAVLQLLDNMPITTANVAALLQPSIEAGSRADEIEKAVKLLLDDEFVPLGEQDGQLRFLSEKLDAVRREQAQITTRAVDRQAVVNEALKAGFDPLPSVQLHGSLKVTTGIKRLSGDHAAQLVGAGEAIQTFAVLVDPAGYEAEKSRLIQESTHKSTKATIYLLGRLPLDADSLSAEIVRCREIETRYRTDPDQEVKSYCRSEGERAARLASQLEKRISESLTQGSFVFRGEATPVGSLDKTLVVAAKKHLEKAAAQVFERYAEAPVRVDTALAEKLLKTPVKSITSQLDPLNLVKLGGSVDTSHKGLVSIKDHLDVSGRVEGKKLTDHFAEPPFGWSPDTVRYMIAALLVAGEVKLRVSGRDVTAVGQQAVDALKTNASFKTIGVSLRSERLPTEVLARAAARLTTLSGEQVLPLEQEIAKAARGCLPELQRTLAQLPGDLDALRLPGAETVRSVSRQIVETLASDASDSPASFGAEQSALYDAIAWSRRAQDAFDQGIEKTIRPLRDLNHDIAGLPTTGVPRQLREAAREDLQAAEEILSREDFFEHKADLATKLTRLQECATTAVADMRTALAESILAAKAELLRLPVWGDLTAEEQDGELAVIDALIADKVPLDIVGLKSLVARQFDIVTTAGDVRKKVVETAEARRAALVQSTVPRGEVREKTLVAVGFPARVATVADLDALIQKLLNLREELAAGEIDIELTAE